MGTNSINNSAKIGTMLSFNDDDFYFIQILKRRKDNVDLNKNSILINNYYINSLDEYIKTIPQIIKTCDIENARAYFRLNKRNYKHLSFHMIKRVVDMVASGDYKAIKRAFESVAGEYHNDNDKTWVVDIDFNDIKTTENPNGEIVVEEIINEVTKLQGETKKEPMIEIIPTKNGVHLITRPFNLHKFKEKFPLLDVHKDNPTILYCP